MVRSRPSACRTAQTARSGTHLAEERALTEERVGASDELGIERSKYSTVHLTARSRQMSAATKQLPHGAARHGRPAKDRPVACVWPSARLDHGKVVDIPRLHLAGTEKSSHQHMTAGMRHLRDRSTSHGTSDRVEEEKRAAHTPCKDTRHARVEPTVAVSVIIRRVRGQR